MEKQSRLIALKNAKAAQFLGVNAHWLAGDPKYEMLDISNGLNFDNNVDLSQKISLRVDLSLLSHGWQLDCLIQLKLSLGIQGLMSTFLRLRSVARMVMG